MGGLAAPGAGARLPADQRTKALAQPPVCHGPHPFLPVCTIARGVPLTQPCVRHARRHFQIGAANYCTHLLPRTRQNSVEATP